MSNPFSANQSPLGTVSEMSSDIVNFAAFSRLSSPPAPASPTASMQRGVNLFIHAGCALCHSPSLTTAASPFAGMGGVTYHPFSDFAVHHMGSGLADGITQGLAGPDEFRTAPILLKKSLLLMKRSPDSISRRNGEIANDGRTHSDAGSAVLRVQPRTSRAS
jgi:CxxC motif-containing protein (DUF1111 family)